MLVFHYIYRYSELYQGEEERGGANLNWLRTLGVPLFFIISGVVIPMTLDRGLEGARGWGLRVRAVWNFAAARAARLYPAFWTAVGVTSAALAWFGLAGRGVGVRDALLNLTMLPSRFGARRVDGAYWSLEAEWMFYALVAAVALVGLRRWLHWVLAAMVAVELLRPGWALGDLTAAVNGVKAIKQAGAFVLPSASAVFFLTGILLYEQRRVVRAGRVTWWIGPLVLLCFVRIASRRDDLSTAIYALDVLLVHAAINFRMPLLANPVLVFAGAISYSLYLVHQNIGYIVMQRADGAGMPRAASVGLAAAVAVGLAAAITFGVERPGNRVLRKWLMVGVGAKGSIRK